MINWKATDKWGWELSKCGIRDLKISNLLEEGVDFEMKYKIRLHRPDELYIVLVWFEFNRTTAEQYAGFTNNPAIGFISFNSVSDSSISIKLPCKSFKDAEILVEMVCQANNLKVMPAYIS